MLFPSGPKRSVSEVMKNNLWAIFDFALHVVQQWIVPPLNAETLRRNWEMICMKLRSSRRKRKLQLEQWEAIINLTT